MINRKLSFDQRKTIKKITYFIVNCFTVLFSVKQSKFFFFLTLVSHSLRLRTSSKLSLPLCSSLSSVGLSQAIFFFFTDQHQIRQIDTRSTIGKVIWLIFIFLDQKMLQCLFLCITQDYVGFVLARWYLIFFIFV